MSEPREEAMTREQRAARDAVRALPRPMADPALRARLKREFVSGSIRETGRLAPRGEPWWRTRWALALAPAAAAAMVVAVVFLGHGPDWTVVSAPGDGVAMVGGREIPFARRDELERALRRGGSIRVTGQRGLELVVEGQLAVEILPGSDATLPHAAGRWLGRVRGATLRAGELRIGTGAGFRGARLSIATPEAKVEIVGTTLAVIRESVGTCVCVMEGRVRMGAPRLPMASIEPGMRRFVFNDGRAPEVAEMRPVEKAALGDLRRRHSSRLD